MLDQILIEDAEIADDRASLVGQQRIGDAVLRGELGEAGLIVVADREQRIARALKVVSDPLQLDQLRLAIRSPPGASVEHDHRPSRAPRGVQVHDGAALIRQPDIGKAVADLGAALAVVHWGHRPTVAPSDAPSVARTCAGLGSTSTVPFGKTTVGTDMYPLAAVRTTCWAAGSSVISISRNVMCSPVSHR